MFDQKKKRGLSVKKKKKFVHGYHLIILCGLKNSSGGVSILFALYNKID